LTLASALTVSISSSRRQASTAARGNEASAAGLAGVGVAIVETVISVSFKDMKPIIMSDSKTFKAVFDDKHRIWINWRIEDAPQPLTKVVHPCTTAVPPAV
jgi:hypothetical protein